VGPGLGSGLSRQAIFPGESALVAALSHFPELEAKLELLGSVRNAALMEDQVDALQALACPASDLLALHVLPLAARGP
jgi:hypothetical protein